MDPETREKIKQAANRDELFQQARSVKPDELGGRDVSLLARKLDELPAEPDLRIAYLANHTVEPLPEYVAAHGILEGLSLASYVGPYGQYFQEVLQEGGPLQEFEPNIVLLSLTMRELAPRFFLEFASLSAEQIAEEKERVLSHLASWIEGAKARTNALVLVANFPAPAQYALGVADGKQDSSEAELYLDLNLQLLRRLKPDARAGIFDLERLLSSYGKREGVSPKMYYMAKIPWQEGFYSVLAREVLRWAIAAGGRAKKCLVTDLDNTLWGGVVGEDGPAAIQVGPGSPDGEAYLELQHAIRSLKERGVVLSICSKNNPDDAKEAFSTRPEMPLKLSDFSVPQINWEPKAKNLINVAETLNIGIDKLAFLDDNPMERTVVEGALPEVATVALPSDPAGFARALREQIHFERLQITAEDKKKTRQYEDDARRTSRRREIHDLDAYLQELHTRVVVRPATSGDVPRIHQLFTKTNQFNVTTRRYSVGEIERMLEDDVCHLALAQAGDVYGDLGIIGLYLTRTDGDVVEVDSFVMSCRALGRGIETVLMNCLKTTHLTGSPARTARARFIPTKKNKPADGFFEAQGFQPVPETGPEDEKRFVLPAGEAKIIPCPHIELTLNGEPQ
jgi:FkbH-like protein